MDLVAAYKGRDWFRRISKIAHFILAEKLSALTSGGVLSYKEQDLNVKEARDGDKAAL